MLDRYQDMLDLPRPLSPTHAPMRRRDRAAQFAPFAALTGFDEQIREVAWMQRDAFPYEGKSWICGNPHAFPWGKVDAERSGADG
jgi:hypothetical protein